MSRSAARIDLETRYICWGVGIVGLDNDGYPDILMVTGNVYPGVERQLPQYPNKTPRVLFRNLGNGTFEELDDQARPTIKEPHCNCGYALGDFDNDGDLDILVVNLNAPPSLLRNDVTGNQNWIKVRLEGVKSNGSAIGTRVMVHYSGKKQAQTVEPNELLIVQWSPIALCVGASTVVDVDEFWPNGLHQSVKRIPTNQLLTIREGDGPIPSKGWLRR